MTLMFMSITEMPMILRVYGTAKVIHPRHAEWNMLIGMFPSLAGSRQIFDMTIDSVATSCGSGVPVMTVTEIRGVHDLVPFYEAMTHTEQHDYWNRKNTTSIDGLPTKIFTD